MARTFSKMIPLGASAPDFSLPDGQGKLVSRAAAAGRPLLVMFLSNHCPFVKALNHALAELGRDYLPRGVAIVAISSNDSEAFPADGPAFTREEAIKHGYPFPYLFDESQDTARAYDAACTPDFFLFDKAHRLVYRGQFDGSRPGNEIPVSGCDLRAALDAVIVGAKIPGEQRPSLGCNIKWKPGPIR